jgi:hypothetical protein
MMRAWRGLGIANPTHPDLPGPPHPHSQACIEQEMLGKMLRGGGRPKGERR